MHACISRPLSVFHKEHPTGEAFTLVSIKTPKLMSDQLEGRHANEDYVGQNEYELEFHSNVQKMDKGSDIKVQIISQEENKIREWKNHVRSTMESKLQDSKEDINKSKDNGFNEDVVVMDYAQPHRKPPIHNIDP
ncbi:hypothetical protein QVD17_13352 [Tagetes erecta]|uniref:Uncharacterized protein n=1 Tax=Tagetes erecta TaxID=13708 RepID=A0AAD8KXQ0_TARER|nr:hypothetical protein QVD17_13352 [Tagetes erecta]